NVNRVRRWSTVAAGSVSGYAAVWRLISPPEPPMCPTPRVAEPVADGTDRGAHAAQCGDAWMGARDARGSTDQETGVITNRVPDGFPAPPTPAVNTAINRAYTGEQACSAPPGLAREM